MKVLTLHAPYPVLMTLGLKKHETRSWGTTYRGPLAIHTSMKHDAEIREDIRRFCALFPDHAHAIASCNRFGMITHVVDLVSVVPTSRALPDPDDYRCGDFGPNRFAWRTENLRVLRLSGASWRGLQKLKDLKMPTLMEVIRRLPVPQGHESRAAVGVYCRDHLDAPLTCETCKKSWSPCCGEMPPH